MFNNLNKVFSLVAIILYTAEGLYIHPVYDYFNRIKRGPPAICVQIQPNGAGNQKPYFMCKDPELPARQTARNLAYPTARNYENFNENPTLNVADFSKKIEESIQHIQPAQIYQLGNSNENIYDSMRIPFATGAYQSPLKAAADYGYYQENTEPSKRHRAEHAIASPLLSFAHPQDSDNVHETQLSPDISQTGISPAAITNQEEPIERNDNAQDFIPTAAEQYKSLLEDEVLAGPEPQLGFSSDRMLSTQNLLSEPIISLAPQAPQIPPEYYEDPVLRTFYNIDHHPQAGPLEKPYFKPTVTKIRPVSPAPMLAAKNSNDFSNSSPQPISAGYRSPTESTRKCFDWPFSFQPIFIAVPLYNAPYQDPKSNKQNVACIQWQNINGIPMHDDFSKESYRAPSEDVDDADANEDMFIKDLPHEKITYNPADKTKKIDLQAEKTPTSPSDASEEDLFVEDSTMPADKAPSKYANDESNENTRSIQEISTSTIGPAQPTPKSFKSLLNAAKTHAVRFHDSNANASAVMPQSANKRHIPYINAGIYPWLFKRQYVRKL